jgi:hypothetical protein
MLYVASSTISNALFAWFISHQPAVLFSHNKPATSNQPAVLFSQNKPAPAICRRAWFSFCSDSPARCGFFFFLPWVPSGSLGALLQLLFFSFPFSF